MRCGTEVAKFRVGTPSKEVLDRIKVRWAVEFMVDHEGFEVTPSSPSLDPGVYEYKLSKFCNTNVLPFCQIKLCARECRLLTLLFMHSCSSLIMFCHLCIACYFASDTAVSMH